MATAAEVAAQPTNARPVETSEFRKARPEIVGPETPADPFPIYMAGPVQKGFGRGSKDLGCPTANLPDDCIASMAAIAKTGVYYGYAQVIPPKDQSTDLAKEDVKVHPMVMSLGWNPYYKNERLTAEIHIMHEYQCDFYGHELRTIVLGYIRPELDYTSLEALIEDIETDKRVATTSLQRPDYSAYATNSQFDLTCSV